MELSAGELKLQAWKNAENPRKKKYKNKTSQAHRAI